MPKAPKKISPWEDIILRGIGIYKMLHGLFFIAVGFGLASLIHQNIPHVLTDYVIRPLGVGPENKIVDWALREAEKLTAHKIRLLSYAVFFYAFLFCIEGVGLYLRKHWAEYFVVIATGSLLPFEIWIFIHRVEWWKLGAIVANLLIVGYLIHRLWLDERIEEPPGATVPPDAPSPGAPEPQREVSEVEP